MVGRVRRRSTPAASSQVVQETAVAARRGRKVFLDWVLQMRKHRVDPRIEARAAPWASDRGLAFAWEFSSFKGSGRSRSQGILLDRNSDCDVRIVGCGFDCPALRSIRSCRRLRAGRARPRPDLRLGLSQYPQLRSRHGQGLAGASPRRLSLSKSSASRQARGMGRRCTLGPAAAAAAQAGTSSVRVRLKFHRK